MKNSNTIVYKILRYKLHIFSSIKSLFVKNKQDYIVSIDRPVVLISQIQRSGGTLLSQLFDGHSECFSHPSEITIGSPKNIWPFINLEKSRKAIFSDLKESHIDADIVFGYKKYGRGKNKTKALPFVFDKRNYRRIFVSRSKNSNTSREILNAYFTAYFNAWVDCQNIYKSEKKFIVGFTPRVNFNKKNSVIRFFKDYPDGYLISIIRNPLSWYASAKKHSKGYENIENSMDLWTESVLSTLFIRAKFNNVIIITFEDLVKDTPRMMKILSEKLGIVYEDILEIPTFNTIPIKSDSSFDSRKGVNKEVVDRSMYLEKHEKEYIESRCLDLYCKAQNESL